MNFSAYENVVFYLQAVSVGRRRLSADFQLLFRLIEGTIFIAFLAIFISLLAFAHMTVLDIIVCILALSPTGWGLLQVCQRLFLRIVFRLYGIFNQMRLMVNKVKMFKVQI